MQNKTYRLLLLVCIIALLLCYFHIHCPGDQSIRIDDSAPLQYSTTIVTAFFLFSKSKHSFNDYKQWNENLLTYTNNPMVIFTSKSIHTAIENLRTAHPNNTCKSHPNCFSTLIITDYDTPWEMPAMKNLTDILRSQWDIDPEKKIHSPDLYAMWNVKSWMLKHVAVFNPFSTKYFLWIDSGAFRSNKYRFGRWPNNERAVNIFERNGPDKLLLGLVKQFPSELCTKLRNNSSPNSTQDGPVRRDLIQGAIIGGSRESILWWSDLYYETIRFYISKGWFVGKDQATMNALTLAYQHRINVFLAFRVSCDDPWFAFGPLFAEQSSVQTNFGLRCQLGNLSSIVVSPSAACPS